MLLSSPVEAVADPAGVNLDPIGAQRRVAEDMGQDWMKDPIYRSDVLDSVLDDPDLVLKRLSENRMPRRGMPVPVPKNPLAIRPAVDLRVIDRICFQTRIDSFAHRELAQLPNFVCGWRYAENVVCDVIGARRTDEWRRYQSILDDYWWSEPRFILVTDLAGFFEAIPHRLLFDSLFEVDVGVRNLLLDYLRHWRPSEIGLPQRVLGSSLLANAYLAPVDDVLGDYRSVRWMDDIAIFSDSRREAIEAILRIQEALPPLNLFLNAAKTRLVPYDEAEGLIIDLRAREIEYNLRRSQPGERSYEAGTNGLSDVWKELMSDPDSADRTRFSFCVTRFLELDWDEPGSQILASLSRLPHVSDHASRYLRSQVDDNPAVLTRLSRFIRGSRNQYAWQEYRLATLFWHARELSRRHLDLVRRRAASRNTYWAARNIYFRALGRHGSRDDARRMRDWAETEPDTETVRGLVIGGFESGYLSRRQLQHMARDDPDLSRLFDYLKARDGRVPPISF